MNKDWGVVKQKVEISNIPRFNYKKLLGESLTSFITKNNHLDTIALRNEVLRQQEVRLYLDKNPHLVPRFINNIETSISSRKAEQKTYEGRK